MGGWEGVRSPRQKSKNSLTKRGPEKYRVCGSYVGGWEDVKGVGFPENHIRGGRG